MKLFQKTFGVLLLAFLMVGPVGCSRTTLEPGSPYSVEGQAADVGFYATDAAFELAVSAFTTVTDFEKNNRQALWNISPEIKHGLDKARPEAKAVTLAYARARRAYVTYPTPAGLSTLDTVLGRMQQLAAAAQTALPKSTK